MSETIWYSFICLIKFCTLINGRKCSQRNHAACLWKPIICLSSARLQSTCRFNGVHIIMWITTWEKGSSQMFSGTDQSCVGHGRFPLPLSSPSCYRTMKYCHYGEGRACKKGWLQVHLPVELTFNQKLWRLLIPPFFLAVRQHLELSAVLFMFVKLLEISN